MAELSSLHFVSEAVLWQVCSTLLVFCNVNQLVMLCSREIFCAFKMPTFFLAQYHLVCHD